MDIFVPVEGEGPARINPDNRNLVVLEEWQGETQLKIRPKQPTLETRESQQSIKVRGIEDKAVKQVAETWLVDGTGRVRAYPLTGSELPGIGNGGQGFEGVEIDIVLEERPDNNVFSFEIDTKGLEFLYQPPLYQEQNVLNEEGVDKVTATRAYDKSGGVIIRRPEPVVGSYAVYHNSKGRIHRSSERADKYKVGKAFHIYRPKVTDARGDSVYADLEIKGGEMRVKVPETFLNTAVYPVVVDPTTGYETKGGTEYGYITNGRTNFSGSSGYGSFPSSGQAHSITAYFNTSGTQYQTNFGLYSGGVGAASISREDYSNEFVGTDDRWITKPVQNLKDLSGLNREGHLWMWSDGASSGSPYGYYDSGGSDEMWASNSNETYSSTPPSDPGKNTDFNRRLSIYMTYYSDILEVDDFESGNTFSNYTGDTGDYDTSTASVFGNTSLDCPSDGNWHSMQSDSGLDSYPVQGDTFEFWFIPSDGDYMQTYFAIQNATSDGSPPDNCYAVEFDNEGYNSWRIFKRENGSSSNLFNGGFTADFNNDEWHRCVVDWASDGTITVTVYSHLGSQMDQETVTDTTFESGGIGYRDRTTSLVSGKDGYIVTEPVSDRSTDTVGSLVETDSNGLVQTTDSGVRKTNEP
jgi:hypothetical protein